MSTTPTSGPDRTGWPMLLLYATDSELDAILVEHRCRNRRACSYEFAENGVTKFWNETEDGIPTGRYVVVRRRGA